MPLQTLYLVRHGQTEWNRLGRRQGQLDSPLTAQGEATAWQQGDALIGQPIDALFSSPPGRARATAELINEKLHLPDHVLTDLREVDHGQFAGLSDSDIAAHHPGSLQARAADKYHWRFPNGESYADGDARTRRALTSIAAQVANGD